MVRIIQSKVASYDWRAHGFRIDDLYNVFPKDSTWIPREEIYPLKLSKVSNSSGK